MIQDAATFTSIWSALGATVVHFLWQGALIGLVAGVALWGLRRHSPETRYAVAYGALLVCILSFVATLLVTLATPAAEHALQAAFLGDPSRDAVSPGFGAADIAAWCWALGVACMALRFTRQCYGVRRLQTTLVSEPDAHWQRIFQVLKAELGIAHGVRLLRSGLAEVPMVVGWLSPIVVVPASAFTGLSPDQLRSLLAHELAHIRRHDHWLNAAQAVVEIVLFFHPVVWLLSKQVRTEREYCCDDSSVRVTGDPRLLAEALASMATLRINQPATHPVLAANGGPLMQRIARIIGARLDGRTSPTSWHLPAGLVLAGVLAVAGSAYATPAALTGDEPVAKQDAQKELVRIDAELKAMIESGKITEAQAKERIAAYKKQLAEKSKTPQRSSDQVSDKDVWARLQAGIDSGRITEAQAKERFALWQAKQGEHGNTRQAAEIDGVKLRIQMAVEAGEMTPEQGKARLEGYMKAVEERRAAQELELQAAAARLASAVEAGEMTPEQARARLTKMKQKMAASSGIRKRANEDPEAAILKIQAAVEAGRLTPEQGKAKIEAYKAELKARKAARAAYGELERRIKADVEAGKLTPDEAKQQLLDFRKSLGEKAAKQK